MSAKEIHNEKGKDAVGNLIQRLLINRPFLQLLQTMLTITYQNAFMFFYVCKKYAVIFLMFKFILFSAIKINLCNLFYISMSRARASVCNSVSKHGCHSGSCHYGFAVCFHFLIDVE